MVKQSKSNQWDIPSRNSTTQASSGALGSHSEPSTSKAEQSAYSLDSELLEKYKNKLSARTRLIDGVHHTLSQNSIKTKPNPSGGVAVDVVGVRSSNTYTEKMNGYGRFSAKQDKYEPSSNVTFCDYLKVLIKDVDMRDETLYSLAGEGGVFKTVGITIEEAKNKATGYDTTVEFRMKNPDDEDETFNAGFFYFSDSGKMKGGFIELKGQPCQIMQSNYPEQWNELLNQLEYHGWRVSSADVALDIHGELAIDEGITVPRLDMQAGLGLFASDKLKNGNISKVKRVILGDQSDITDGLTTRETYDPREFCLDGLTLYTGSKRSADKWKCYEKTKELLSKGKGVSEDKNELAWVRIEHTMKKTTTKPVSWDVLRNPDKHFSRDRSGLIEIMQTVRQRAKLDNVESILSETIKKSKDCKMRHGFFWASQSSRKVIKEGRQNGLSNEEILYRLENESSKATSLEEIAANNRSSQNGASVVT